MVGLQARRVQKSIFVPSPKELRGLTRRLPPVFPQRDRVRFELLYKCGIGVSEVVHLNVPAVDLASRTVVVTGRGGRERYISLPKSTVKTLKAYLPKRLGVTNSASNALVLNLRGGRLTSRSVGRVIKALGSTAKTSEDIHPHALRQAFAVHSLNSGKDIEGIRHDLGATGAAATLRIGQRYR